MRKKATPHRVAFVVVELLGSVLLPYSGAAAVSRGEYEPRNASKTFQGISALCLILCLPLAA